MKKKILHVENFGPISDATVELRAINMFIGEQSVGKSTLAKLITIFTDYISLCKIIHGGESAWNTQLKDYNLDIYKSDAYHITYDMAEEDQMFHIEFVPGKISFFMKKGEVETNDVNEITTRILQLKKNSHREEAVNKASIDFENNALLDILTNSIYIPAERIIYSVLTNLMPALALANSTIPKNLLRFMVDLGNAKSEYPMLHIPLLNITFRHESSEDSIITDNEKKNIPMPAASSGIQSLVPLLLALKYATTKREYSSFVIEEPECNLFPTKQVELLKEILRIVKSSTRTLTITTHSPYLLSAMNNILFAGMLTEKYGNPVKEYVDGIIPEVYQLRACDCSVYSLGKDINGGIYCMSLMDTTTGMIDFNSLDGISEELSNEFEALQNSAIGYIRNNRQQDGLYCNQ